MAHWNIVEESDKQRAHVDDFVIEGLLLYSPSIIGKARGNRTLKGDGLPKNRTDRPVVQFYDKIQILSRKDWTAAGIPDTIGRKEGFYVQS